VTEIILPYNRDAVAQETGYWCGPASIQMALSARGIHLEESELARQCGSTEDGTSFDNIARVLNSHIHDAEYVAVWMANDPPTDEDVETFFRNVRTSTDAGFSVVLNFWAPQNNPPFPIKNSGPCPSFYGFGGDTMHYTSLHGYSDDDGVDAVWIADSGGPPWGYWITARQCAILCAGRGYFWAKPHNAPGIPTLPGPAPAVTQSGRFWPVTPDRFVTSGFGPRDGGFHTGTDFGFHGGSGGRPVYAIQSGTVLYAGPAQGYGGPDPAGWLVIDSDTHEGGGVWEYGHIVRAAHLTPGTKVVAGQEIGIINPSEDSNGGVDPHLHVAYMPRGYDPGSKVDPLPILDGANNPGESPQYEHWPVENDDPYRIPAESAAVVVESHRESTPLTGYPHHHSIDEDLESQVRNVRAEGLLTQRLVWALAEAAGIDARRLYDETRDAL